MSAFFHLKNFLLIFAHLHGFMILYKPLTIAYMKLVYGFMIEIWDFSILSVGLIGNHCAFRFPLST